MPLNRNHFYGLLEGSSSAHAMGTLTTCFHSQDRAEQRVLDLIKVNAQVRAPQVHTSTNTYVVLDCFYPGQRRVLFSETLQPEPSKATEGRKDPMISGEAVESKQQPERKEEREAMEVEPSTIAELRPRYCGQPEWQLLAATATDTDAVLQHYRLCSPCLCVLSHSGIPGSLLMHVVASLVLLAEGSKLLLDSDGLFLSAAHCEDKGELQRRLREVLPPPPPAASIEPSKTQTEQQSTGSEQSSKTETGGNDFTPLVC